MRRQSVSRMRHPRPGVVQAYLEATDGEVYCTNRHGTVRVYGYVDGRIRVTRQIPQDKSCIFDGTHSWCRRPGTGPPQRADVTKDAIEVIGRILNGVMAAQFAVLLKLHGRGAQHGLKGFSGLAARQTGSTTRSADNSTRGRC